MSEDGIREGVAIFVVAALIITGLVIIHLVTGW